MTNIYVNMNDKFMSGWGIAEHGRSILCIECETREQADAILKAAEDRSEMKFIALSDKPRKGRLGDIVTYRKFSDMGGPWLSYFNSNTEV